LDEQFPFNYPSWQKKEKNKLLERLRYFQKSALEAQQLDNEYKVCGSGFKMKC
jgi:hypothetical protein